MLCKKVLVLHLMDKTVISTLYKVIDSVGYYTTSTTRTSFVPLSTKNTTTAAPVPKYASHKRAFYTPSSF
jgi:hypothetical protein